MIDRLIYAVIPSMRERRRRIEAADRPYAAFYRERAARKRS